MEEKETLVNVGGVVMTNKKINWCWLGIHDYSNWTDKTIVVPLDIGYGIEIPGVEKHAQERRCIRCNKLQMRLVEVA